jgi:hypothetical protein
VSVCDHSDTALLLMSLSKHIFETVLCRVTNKIHQDSILI